jgi:hypothetical protein
MFVQLEFSVSAIQHSSNKKISALVLAQQCASLEATGVEGLVNFVDRDPSSGKYHVGRLELGDEIVSGIVVYPADLIRFWYDNLRAAIEIIKLQLPFRVLSD